MLLARNPRGQLAFCISLFLALAVFLLGMLSYEISEYFLAQQELQAVAQAAALTCSTKLASLTSPDSSTSQNDAFATGTSIFQGNSVLGNSLAGAMQTSPSDPPSPLAQGQATICFQLLDPNTFQPA